MSTDQTRNDLPTAMRSGGKKTDTAAATQAGRSDRLSALAEGTPKFKSGQIRGLWPQIANALARGHKLKQIWEWMRQDGLDVSYSRFRHCVSDLKLMDGSGRSVPIPHVKDVSRRADPESPEFDPAKNLRERLNKRPGFQFDERPPDLKKLVGI